MSGYWCSLSVGPQFSFMWLLHMTSLNFSRGVLFWEEHSMSECTKKKEVDAAIYLKFWSQNFQNIPFVVLSWSEQSQCQLKGRGTSWWESGYVHTEGWGMMVVIFRNIWSSCICHVGVHMCSGRSPGQLLEACFVFIWKPHHAAKPRPGLWVKLSDYEKAAIKIQTGR